MEHKLYLQYWRSKTKGASNFTQRQDAEVLYVAVNCKDGNSIITYLKLKLSSKTNRRHFI